MAPSESLDVVADLVRDDGYAVLSSALSDHEVADLRHALTIAEAHRPRPEWNPFELGQMRIYNLLARGDVFARLANHQTINLVVDRILGDGALISSVNSIPIDPGTPVQPLHSDDQGSSLPRVPGWPLYLTFIVSLTGMDAASGGTRIVPRSHRRPEPLLWTDAGNEWNAAITVPELAAGDVLVYDGGLYHGAGANTSTTRREAVGMSFCRGSLRPIENQLLGIPPEVVRKFSPRLVSRCGYSMFNEIIGHVDGRNPRDLLYPTDTSEVGVTTMLNSIDGSYECYDRRLEIQAELSAREEIDHLGRMAACEGVRSVVDVGCGNGSFLVRLADAWPDIEFQGIDTDPGAIALAKERRPRKNVRYDVGCLADVGDPADLLLSRFCLLYVDEPEVIVEWCADHIALGAVQIDPADELWGFPSSLAPLESIMPGRLAVHRDGEARTPQNTTLPSWTRSGFGLSDSVVMTVSSAGTVSRACFLGFCLLEATFAARGVPPHDVVTSVLDWYRGDEEARYGVRLTGLRRIVGDGPETLGQEDDRR